MMRSYRSNNLYLFVGLILVLLLMTFNWRNIESQQEKDRLNIALVNDEMPTTLALTTQAVGPLRGLISNSLWWRSQEMQDQGNYFEAIQLASWITIMQPRLPQAWNFQAWNMSYNISAAVEKREERWKWINQGRDLLQNKGLRYNPDQSALKNELTNFYANKIGRDLEHSQYYQAQWANLISDYVGDGSVNHLRKLFLSADSVDNLLKSPKHLSMIKRANSEGVNLLDFKSIKLIKDDSLLYEAIVGGEDKIYNEIMYFLNKEALRNEFNLDVDKMIKIDNRYGPFDWRLYHAHAIYWGDPEDREKDDYSGMIDTTFRQVLLESVYNGRLTKMGKNQLITAPNFDAHLNVHDFLLDFMLANRGDETIKKLVYEMHERMVVLLYINHYLKESQLMFDDYNSHRIPMNDEPYPSYEAFMKDNAIKIISTSYSRDDNITVRSLLVRAYSNLILGNIFQAKGYEKMAKLVWTKNQKTYAKVPNLRLSPYPTFKKQTIAWIVKESEWPQPLKNKLIELSGEDGSPDIILPEGERTIDILGDQQ